MKVPEYSNARVRLAVLFSLPLAFSVLFFAESITSEHNESQILGLELLHANIGALRGVANDAEIGEHGLLLTGDEHYLGPLQAAKTRLDLVRDSIRRDEAQPDLQPKVDRLLVNVDERLRDADQVVGIQRSQGTAAAVEFARTGSAGILMDNIRTEVTALQAEVTRRTDIHRNFDHKLTNWSFLFFLFGTAVTLLVMFWLYRSFLSYMESRNAYMRARDAAHVELRALNADLERRIELRTQELQQFNEELQQFAYVASHDLKEPLRTVTSFAQLLASRYRGRLDSDADEFISYIVNSASRMTDLINGLLTLARLRQSGQPITPVPLESVVNEAIGNLQGAIRENDARIELSPLPHLIADRMQFGQVFQNLISNAIKYRSDAAPVIQIRAKRDSSHWIISVQDNGRGFDQQFAERIFGLFQRLHGQEVDGTGMGLALARRIVERHGGRMWAESVEGVGSTFFIALPLSLEPRTEEETAAPVYVQN